MKRQYLYMIFFLFGLSICNSQDKIPQLNQRITDFTNTLSYQEWQSLEGILKNYEDTTSNQIVVLMVNSIAEMSIEEYANRTFEVNKIGQSKKNNGVLLLISKQDQRLRVEVGYGLEGVLTDAISSRIIREEILPHLRQDNYFGGIIGGIDAIMRTITGEYKANGKGKEAPAVTIILIFFAMFIVFFVLLPMMTSRRRSIIGPGGHQYYSGWGYGGGFPGSFGGKGSSFGGFGGGGFSGGGGLSGGGGATGSW